jgi:hypothetical protein
MLTNKIRLIDLFNRVSRRSIQYSPVYSRTYGRSSVWAEIEPVSGQRNLYTIYGCRAQVNADWDAAVFFKFMHGPKWEHERKRYTKEDTGKSVFSWTETCEILDRFAKGWERTNYAINSGQPLMRKSKQLEWPPMPSAAPEPSA